VTTTTTPTPIETATDTADMVFMPSLTDTTSGTGETTTPGTPGFTLAGALVAVLYFAFSRRRDR